MCMFKAPALLAFGSTCRKLRAATSTECTRLHAAVSQLRKLAKDFRLPPVAMRHAVGLDWRASKRAEGSGATLPLVGVRCARLAGMLHEANSLVCLALSACHLTDAALASLLVPLAHNRMPRLSVLRLDANRRLTDGGAAALAAVMRAPCEHCGCSFPVHHTGLEPCASCGQLWRGERRGIRISRMHA